VELQEVIEDVRPKLGCQHPEQLSFLFEEYPSFGESWLNSYSYWGDSLQMILIFLFLYSFITVIYSIINIFFLWNKKRKSIPEAVRSYLRSPILSGSVQATTTRTGRTTATCISLRTWSARCLLNKFSRTLTLMVLVVYQEMRFSKCSTDTEYQ